MTLDKIYVTVFLTKGEKYIDMFLDHNHDIVDIFHIRYHVKTNPDSDFYDGNFWRARGTYLKHCFELCSELEPYYFAQNTSFLQLNLISVICTIGI